MSDITTDRIQGVTTSVAIKAPCLAVAITPITLAGLQTIGGITVAEDDRVLVIGQADTAANGIYNASTGAWSRALDFDGARDVTQGTLVTVVGTGNQCAIYECTTTDPVIGTSNLVFALRFSANTNYDRTAGEILGGVTPANPMYPPGDVRRYGAVGDGVHDDTVAIQSAVSAQPSGGEVFFPQGKFLITSKITVAIDGLTWRGVSHSTSDAFGSVILCATGTADAIEWNDVDGGRLVGLRISGSSMSGSSYLFACVNGTQNIEVSDSRFVNGVNGIKLQNVNTIRFRGCVISTFSGSQCVLLNGVSDGNRADPVEFTNCSISAGGANITTDNVVLDGQGGSLKFIGCAILSGRHGIWLKNTTGGDIPFFLYFSGGGFENGVGAPIKLDAGSKAFIGGSAYVSSDGEEPGILVASTWSGELVIAGAYIRGNGRSGIDLGAGGANISGCKLVNNAFSAGPTHAYTVSGAADNGAGAIRITLSSAVNWRTGDRIRIGSVTGTVEANGDWPITLIDTTHADLVGSTFANAYVSGGTAYLLAHGIWIRSGVTHVTAAANTIGLAEDGGVNRQDYGIFDEGTANVTEPNNYVSNATGNVLRTNANRDAGTGFNRLANVNRIINGQFGLIQRGGSALAVSDDSYGPDCWNILAQSNPIQFDQLSIPYSGTRKACRLTQSNASAQRFGISQIIEGADSIDLRGRTVTLGGRYRCSVANQTLRFFLLEWTGTEDAVTSDVVLSWTTATFTVNNFFINSTLSINGPQAYTTLKDTWVDFDYTVTLGARHNNLFLFAYISGTQAQNTTLDFADVYLVPGRHTVYPFNPRAYAVEKALADRFLFVGNIYVPATTAQNLRTLNMRATPAITGGAAGFTSTGTTKDSLIAFQTGAAVQTLTLSAEL